MSGKKISSIQCIIVFVLIGAFLLAPEVLSQEVPDNILDKIQFRCVGPSKQGGRVNDFGVPDQHKQPYTFYVAFSTGGLWKTTDNGLTYKPVSDDIEINSIGDVAVSHSHPDIVWIGTGNVSYYGMGMYKSSDAGKTWNHMGLKNSYYVTRIRIHPKNPDIIYVAATGWRGSNDPERGVFKTTDGGKTWEKSLNVMDGDDYVGAGDLVMDPSDPETLYASAWDRKGGEASSIYKTIDGGKTWTEMNSGLPQNRIDKIGLDIYLRNPKILYAVAISVREKPDERGENIVFRSDDAGESWQRISPKDIRIKGSSRYGQIRVDPNDENHVYVLSTGVQTTDDGGKTWYRGIRFGGDNQAMWINPDNSDHMLLGYDYGMAISYSGGKTWYHPDNLPCGLFYAVGIDMDFPYNVYGGTQDFGTWKGPSTKRGRFSIRFEDWQHVRGADGAYVQVDPTDSRWIYVESQNGSISRNDQKTSVRKSIRYRKEGIRFNFIAPILISPHNPNVIYHGANVLLRSPFRGEDWQEISPDLTNKASSPKDRRIKGTITTLDESPVEQGVIWVGTDDGNVQLTRDGGKTWTKLNDRIPNYPAYTVTRIIASFHKQGTAYLTLSGLRSDFDLKPYVYITTDYGQTWTSITNNLPKDEPVNVIREDHKNPNLLFVGTAKSIYASIDGGKTWAPMRNNMPYIPIHDFCIHPRENDLVVGTYGRSIWIADISPLQELTPEVLAKEEHLFDIESQVLWILAEQTQVGAALQNFHGENAPHGVVVNYYLKNKAQDEVKVQVYRGTWLVNEYTGSGNPGLNSVQWYLTERLPRTEKEKREYDEQYSRDEEEFFDYYDGHDHFGEADEEVSIYGRSLEIWIHELKEWRERDYKHIRAKPGEYTIKLLVNGKEFAKKALVLKDHWYDRGY
ncbi:MAG: hypothetical protein V3V48_07665 [Candidatus Aminicenantaceae bacterium]